MGNTNPTRIHLQGRGKTEEFTNGNVALTPGHLVEVNSGDGTLRKHPTAGAHAEPIFVVEDALQGNGIDDNYAAGALTTVVVASPGDKVFAFVDGGEVIGVGQKLTSHGDGVLSTAGAGDEVVAVAEETTDLSDSGAADTRVRVRVV